MGRCQSWAFSSRTSLPRALCWRRIRCRRGFLCGRERRLLFGLCLGAGCWRMWPLCFFNCWAEPCIFIRKCSHGRDFELSGEGSRKELSDLQTLKCQYCRGTVQKRQDLCVPTKRLSEPVRHPPSFRKRCLFFSALFSDLKFPGPLHFFLSVLVHLKLP